MKITQLLEARLEPNAYFSVVAPLKVWRHTGFKPTNYYYGASQMFGAVYEPMELEAGDELHWLHGGLFAVHGDTANLIRLTPRGDPSPFERDGSSEPRLRLLNQLISAGTVKQLTASTARKVNKYDVPE